MNEINPLDIAIIGMACYFPEADNLAQYWDNLAKGICSVKFYSDEELIGRNVDKMILQHPNYVKASPYFSRTRLFDASFFNVNPGEANIMDPQRRLFIENCWQALEDAGYVPEKYPDKIGVFGSTGINFYMMNLMGKADIISTVGGLQLLTVNDKDGLPTQTSYLLNLKGPSININTACSSTLVAIHLARQSLFMGDSDMALAGGAALIIPENVGYFYERDGIVSHDGFCRAFDDDSDGTLWGSGSGVVLLKRLSDAINDGDNIRAVIKGSAINNDGSEKVGYTAPSVEGQSEVIVQAYASSGIPPESIQYIEAHGTGTKIGDPIEVTALTRAFREFTRKKRFCGLGSVKTNFGHLGATAGIASFIKAVLSLENRHIPPSLHFKKSNRTIDFENSPFYVNTELREMKKGEFPLRIGVSSLGVGGTNVHIILEEGNEICNKGMVKSGQENVIILSARTAEQLDQAKKNIRTYMEQNRNVSLRNIAFTLQNGRRDFKNKIAFTSCSIDNAIEILKDENNEHILNEENYRIKIDPAGNESHKKLLQWFQDEEADWMSLYKDEKPKRMSLPTYPFESDTYWIETVDDTVKQEADSLPRKKENINDWLYYNSWTQTTLPPPAAEKAGTSVIRLIFADRDKVGFTIGIQLRKRGDRIIFVYPGRNFIKKDSDSYEINPEDPQSYQSLLKDLTENNMVPDSVLHFLGLHGTKGRGAMAEIKSVFSFQKYALFSFISLVKSLNKHNITKEIDLISFVSNIFDINGNEEVFPEKSTVLSAMKVIQQEYPHFHNRTVEIDSDFLNNKNGVEILVNEIVSDNKEITCAYRRDKRWVLNYIQVLPEKISTNNGVFRKNGVYFAFGGLTGGMPALYEYIINKYQAHLIIIDDPYLPKEKEWDEWLNNHGPNEINSLKIKTIKRLRTFGVEYIDDIDIFYGRNKLEKTIKELEKKIGAINGVIHAAGGYAAGRVAPLTIPEEDLRKLAYYNLATIGGSFIVINDIFKKRKLDFRYLWTSLSTVLAGPSFLSYGAADSIAASAALKANKMLKQPWVVFNWDSLEAEWFEDLVEENMARIKQFLQGRISEGLLTTEEGNKCLEIISGAKAGFNPVIISCSDLNKRYNIWIKMEKTRNVQTLDDSNLNVKVKPRPHLANPYEAPLSELEKTITGIMEKSLFIEKIGRNDNFFELGGNSLVAIQFASRIRESLKIDFGMERLFENQTVAGISEYITSQNGK